MAKSNSEKHPEALLFDTPQHRAFRDNPFDRILFMAAMDKLSKTTSSTLLIHMPFWAKLGELSALSSLDAELEVLAPGYYNHRNDAIAPGEGLSPAGFAGMEILLNWAGKHWAKRWPLVLAENSKKAIFVFAANMVPAAIFGAHSQKLSPNEIEALRGAGRANLVDVHGLTHERIDDLGKDLVLCEGISRLLHGGAKDSTALAGFLKLEAFMSENGPYGGLRRSLMDEVAFRRGLPEQPLALTKLVDLIHAIQASGAHGQGFPEMVAGGTAVERSLFLALQCSERWLPKLRSAVLRATATSENPAADAPWIDAPFVGDFEISPKKIFSADGLEFSERASSMAKRPGKGARGVAMRAFLGDASAIWSWRNPLSVLRSTDAENGISLASLALSVDDSKIFAEHAGNAAAACMCAMARKPSERKAIGSALAEIASSGFAGVGKAEHLLDFFPDLPHCQDDDGDDSAQAKRAWFANVLATEPMGQLALAMGKFGGLDSANPQGLVGEAKRALGERNLSNAAWKALAANPSLRGLVIKAVSASGAEAAARGAAKVRSPKKEAAHVIAKADASGSSCRARLMAAIAAERMDHPLDACISILSWSASMGVAQDVQAAMLSMLERNPKMRLFFAGIMPSLPKMEALNTAGSLGQCELVMKSLSEDASASRAVAPAIFKSMAAKMARVGAKSSFAEAEATLVRDFTNMLDCAQGLPPGFWSQLSPADPYSHARRMHEEWVHALNQKEMDEDPKSFEQWPSLVDSDRDGRVSCVEMLCGRDLFGEGKAMSHCVSSYADACRAGSSRIISMRLDGSRCSTLELAPMSKRGERISSLDFSSISQRGSVDRWAIVQHSGKCNAGVTHLEILAFASLIEARATAAFHAATAKMIHARELALAEKLAKKREVSAGGAEIRAEGCSKRQR